MAATRKIRMGLVGGGEGAFIGAVHRMAAALRRPDRAGMRSAQQRCRTRGAQCPSALYLPPSRSYADYRAMMRSRARICQRICAWILLLSSTPNHLHLPIALAAIEHGFHVLSDKPATLDLNECKQLQAALRDSGSVLYGLTHTYTGYPLVREARARIAAGELGRNSQSDCRLRAGLAECRRGTNRQ